MSATNTRESKTLITNGSREPLPENLTFFSMANADQHPVHIGQLMLCVAIFLMLCLWGNQIDPLTLIN